MTMDQFSRTRQLLGTRALNRIKHAKVAVFGLGAVGSFAVEALARTGIGTFSLIDFDSIEPSNINRQIYALYSTIGEKKAELAQRRINDINPEAIVEIHDSFADNNSIDPLLSKGFDVVIDAIDGLNSKVNLIVKAKTRGLKIISSMGAAGKRDSTMIKTADLFETSVCPLARFVRRRLRRRGIFRDVQCVYSEEKPTGIIMNTQSMEIEHESGIKPDHGRKRSSLGTVPYITGIFGLMLANLTVDTIINQTP